MAEHVGERSALLARLRQTSHTPVLIVGGGINGISTFRELALQGIPVLLIERGDWCQAASGALSRMIHGGLRYLETGEFGLVKEAVEERNRLLKNAPHCVFPLRTTVPVDSWGGGMIGAGKRFLGLGASPSRRGALLLRSGLALYDAWSGRYGALPRHQLNDTAATRQRWPGFADWVKYSAAYYDAWITAPERLGFELTDDTLQACPQALALNYLSLKHSDGEKITLSDTLTGEEFTLQTHVVVNATGAWIDRLNGALSPTAAGQKLIGGTKGSHLVLRSPELLAMLDGEMIYYENRDGRACLLFPWYGNVLAGTTDIRVDDPDGVICEADEQRYILDSLRFIFPHLSLSDSDVLYTFSGVRPLPASSAATSGAISRNHSLVLIPPGRERDFTTLCLVGGKWTTFRSFGEEAADRVLNLLGQRRKVSTKERAIGGGRNYPGEARKPAWIKALSRESGLSTERIADLLSRYGTRAQAMVKFMVSEPDALLHTLPDWSRNELRYLIRYEQVQTPGDLLIRRTPLAVSGQLTAPAVEEITRLLAHERGWTAAQSEQERAAISSQLRREHGVHLSEV
ncbi:glycerol-3-phosphate dehydrogenase/oxidase [Erwinia sp. P6884]|uniref:glycerol-3-phosphate dehydrogenase/oxidase n=1 Tax=Erwinia sp. P6884 TaxID=3141450 RepID=UPI00318E8238